MSPLVLALVLGAAVAHAGWNLVAKGAEGGAPFVWLAALAGTVLYLPALLLVPLPTSAQALGLMAGSGALHAAYFVLLQRGYTTGDLSVVYPLARGTGPLLSATAAIVLLGERPGAVAVAGAAVIVLAVFSLAPGGALSIGSGTGFALLTGVATAAYTLWDKHAVGAAGLAPVSYYWGTNLACAAILTPVALRRRALLRRVWDRSRGRAALVGVLSPLAYVLVLYALARAPVSVVAPARESSIVIGTLLGVTVLREGQARRRVAAAVAIAAGVAALALA